MMHINPYIHRRSIFTKIVPHASRLLFLGICLSGGKP